MESDISLWFTRLAVTMDVASWSIIHTLYGGHVESYPDDSDGHVESYPDDSDGHVCPA